MYIAAGKSRHPSTVCVQMLSGLQNKPNTAILGTSDPVELDLDILEESFESNTIVPMTIPALFDSSHHNQLVPHAVLSKRANSHHFNERRFPLDNPNKIGRAVAKCKPTGDNAIFDCKVLSRNHALIWFENGKVRS